MVLDIPCAICGAVAMHIEPTAAGDPMVPRGTPPGTSPVPSSSAGVRTDAGTLEFWMALETEAARARVRAAIATGDVPALLRIDEEMVPFYCSDCDASYCEVHWSTRLIFDPELPGWLEEMRGHCPAGHERRIHD